MSQEHKVAQLSDVPPGNMKNVEVDGVSLLISNVEGSVYALSGKCTHYGAPLADGALDGARVICPWHHACFDIRTGDHLDPPGLNALQTFEVRTEDGDIYVTLPDSPETQREPRINTKTDERTFVVVGGGVAGEHAVETLRDEGFTGRLILVSAESEAPYDRTKLSKDLSALESDLHLRDESFYQKRDIERMTAEVTAIDAEAKTVTFKGRESLTYDALLVATGSEPRKLELPGADLEGGVFQLRSLADARAIAAAAKKGSKAVLIGSSFIALELASALRDQDVSVSVVAPEAVPFAKILGERVGKKVRANHEAQGVTFYLETQVRALEGETSVERVVLENGEALEADFVVVGVGVTPRTDLVSGVTRTDDGGIQVDETLKAAESLFAAGDVAQFPLAQTGERVRIEHWRLAAQHGRTAARNMLGQNQAFEGVPYFWSAQPELKLRYVGHAEDFDDVAYEGEVESGKFIAYYLSDGKVHAAAGAGYDAKLAALEHALKRNGLPTLAALKQSE